VPYRLVGHAADRIDDILFVSAQQWGIEAAARYHRLILLAAAAVGETPALPASRDIPHVADLRYLHLRSVRKLAATGDRVAELRHLIIYRVASDGVVEILSVVHDRMLLPPAARQARRAAGRRDEGSDQK
jgi:toxin ParE1/3/4